MCQTAMPSQVIDYTQRAQEVAMDLIGTCEDLNRFATQAEIDDPAFCAELDMRAVLCPQCGWWYDTCDINEELDICEECVE